MRNAKVGDYRKSLVKERAAWRTRLTSFTYDEVPGLGSGIISFESPLTILAGPNGTGKSTLTKCLHATLEGRRIEHLKDARTSSGIVRLEGQLGETEFSRSIDFSKQDDELPEFGAKIVYVDSGRTALFLQSEFRKFESVDDLINGVSPVELEKIDLAAVSRIVCRDYRSVRLYEVEVGDIQPFFEVAYGSQPYNSSTMGDGELAAMLVWWQFWSAPADSVVLLEEPETFLSAGCQKALSEYILSVVVEKRLACIISSHSPGFVEKVADDGLRFVSRQNDGVVILDGDPPPVLLKSVGIRFEKKAQAFVEDTAAGAFLRHILERFNPSLSRRIGITISGGDGEVRKDLEKFEALELEIVGVGVFDGDIDNATIGDKSVKLPGAEPVETLFRDCAGKNVSRLVELTGISDIGIILSSIEGADHHDWLEELARECGVDKGQAFGMLFRLWVEDDENDDTAAELAKKLHDLIFP